MLKASDVQVLVKKLLENIFGKKLTKQLSLVYLMQVLNLYNGFHCISQS